MAEARKTTTKTKTKTVPAKKPATKPKGASVKPKATKTVSETTKTTSKTTKPAQKTKKSASKTIFIILMVVLGIAIVVGGAICVINNCFNNDTVMLENANGDKIKAKRISVEDYKYSVAIPVDFKRLNDDDLKNNYSVNGSAPVAVYSNEAETANIAFMEPTSTLKNDEVEEYLNAIKIVLATGMDVIGTETYEVNGHNVGMIKLSVGSGDQKVYMQMIFFSYEDQVAVISFNCQDAARAEWEKVGDGIIRSLEIE